MSTDSIFENWLRVQQEEGQKLSAESDTLRLMPFGIPGEAARGVPPSRYTVAFSCRGLVRSDDGSIALHSDFLVGIHFAPEHLRRVEPLGIAIALKPRGIFHPNVLFPFICPGPVRPGSSLVELLYQLHAVFTWQKANLADPLNPQAADWARRHWDGRPTDERPLKRKRTTIFLSPRKEVRA